MAREQQPKNRTISIYLWWTLAFGSFFAAVFGIVVMLSNMLTATVEDAVGRSAIFKAEHWTDVFSTTVPNIDDIIAGFPLSREQLAHIEMMTAVGSVFRFKIFDESGNLVFVSDQSEYNERDEDTSNEIAKAVFETGITEIVVKDGSEIENRPDTFVEAYFPAFDTDGRATGVIEVYLDQTDSARMLLDAFRWTLILVPVACAMIFAVPAIGFIYKSEVARKRQRLVSRLARVDVLTGALNRRAFASESETLFDNRIAGDGSIGIIYVDVDLFKAVNDEHGHEFGDAFLCHMVTALESCIRSGDIIGRLGGDEFVVLMPDVTRKELLTIGQRMVEATKLPCTFRGKSLKGSASLGLHVSPRGESASTAFHCADLAVYEAKELGRGRVAEYYPGLDTARQRRLEVEAALRSAVVGDDIEVQFQPLIGVSERQVVGFEALSRLKGPNGTQIQPSVFIPVAEATGMIKQIGLQVLRKAAMIANTWPNDLYLSVNLSPAQFEKGDLVDDIEMILRETGFPATRLELEVTESLLLKDEVSISDQIFRLKELGVSIAMDDFGTGYSSLGYLWKFEFDKLKIDRSFLENPQFDRHKHREIMETIVMLGHKMGMQVTVEGVETEAHQQLLETLNCDQHQGYLYGQPTQGSKTNNLIIEINHALGSSNNDKKWA